MNKRQFVFVLILTFIVVMVWIIADVYHTRPSVPADPNLKTVLDPLDPNFDQEALNEIKNYTPNEVFDYESSLPSPSPTPKPSVIPSPRPSSTPSETSP